MTRTYFALPGNEAFTDTLCRHDGMRGRLELRSFPDGESHLRFPDDVRGADAVLVCTLDRPDGKTVPLLLAAAALKDLGADRVGLVAPYLAYMRQDKRFRPGEGISAQYYAALLSRSFDWLVTVDPHLHRIASLDEVYRIPSRVVHAAPAVAAYIREHIADAVLIGPDEESAQWVKAVAEQAGVPFTVLTKVRRGDRDVDVSVPDVDRHRNRTPVLVDDIISTARTMIETVGHLHALGMRPPVCIGVHGVFADDACGQLREAGVADIVTADSIAHETNRIALAGLVVEGIRALAGEAAGG